MPSVRLRYSKASTASSSVTGTYSARPVSWSQALFRPHSRIIQAGGDRVHRGDLAVLVLAEVGFHAVKIPSFPVAMVAAVSKVSTPRPAASQPDETHSLIFYKIGKGADGIAPPPTQAITASGMSPFLFQNLILISLEITA